MTENITVLTSVKDPANQIGQVFFAGVKSMTIFGIFIGLILMLLLQIFLGILFISVLVGTVISAIFSVHTIFADRRKTKYFELLLQHLEDVFNKNGIHVDQNAIKSLISINKYTVDETTELHGYHAEGSYIVTMKTYEPPASKKMPEKFIVETD